MYVFWVMQFTEDISKDDEQYLLRVTSQRSISKLHGRFRNTSQNHGRIRRKDDQIFEDSRETQSVFQEIEMQLQHGRNPYFRSYSREGTG